VEKKASALEAREKTSIRKKGSAKTIDIPAEIIPAKVKGFLKSVLVFFALTEVNFFSILRK